MADFRRIDAAMLERVSANAKLNLTDEEKSKFLAEMEDILAAFRKLEEADTEGVQPAYHPVKVENVWREDIVMKKKIEICRNTDAMEGGYIIGPKLV